MDNFDRLDSTKSMLTWLTKDPYYDIRARTQQMLAEQVSGTTIQTFYVRSDPHWLTRAVKDKDAPTHVTVLAAGVAFEFEVMVMSNGRLQDLSGVLTWVGYHLNTPDRHTKMWLDINGTLAKFGEGGVLTERLYLQ